MTIRRMRIACCIPKATNTRSAHVMLIVFPLQQWLQERLSMLHFTYLACLLLSQPVRVTYPRTAPTGFRFPAGFRDFPVIKNFQWVSAVQPEHPVNTGCIERGEKFTAHLHPEPRLPILFPS